MKFFGGLSIRPVNIGLPARGRSENPARGYFSPDLSEIKNAEK
jgi:hypothetical protein